MKIDNMLLELESYIENANAVKNMIINQMVKKGDLNEERSLDYLDNWQIIIIKNQWYKRWFNKFKSKYGHSDKDINGWSYKLVKFEEEDE